MSFGELLAENRRLIVLRALTEVARFEANESVLRLGLQQFGHHVGGDIVRADLEFLERHGLIVVERIRVERGELWVAKLTGAGEDVAKGDATHVGVARRGVD